MSTLSFLGTVLTHKALYSSLTCLGRLALMSYHGVILNFSGFQADEEHIVKQYRAIVDKYVVCVLSPPELSIDLV